MAKPHGHIISLLLAASLTTGTALGAYGQQQFGNGWKTDFSNHTVPLDEIVSGGPPKDGIPPIDDPKFESVRKADKWLGDRHPVVVVDMDGVAKAYPLGILMMHEIVNDVVGETPVTVTYCLLPPRLRLSVVHHEVGPISGREATNENQKLVRDGTGASFLPASGPYMARPLWSH